MLMIIEGSHYSDLIPESHIAEFMQSLSMVDGVILNPSGSMSLGAGNDNTLNEGPESRFTDSSSVVILPDEELRRYSDGRIRGGRNPAEENQQSPVIFFKVVDMKELSSPSLPRDENLKIGLVSGSFDLIHLGHVRLINTAKKFCDVLVVAAMSTSSLRQQEKNVHGDRPVYSQDDRITVLSALRSVDYITVFDERDCKEVIKTLRPHIYFKHIKDMERKVVREECDLVRSLGGEVIVTNDVACYSSTDIINHIRRHTKG
jgi:rfaE bifunctional protein nucleotidyltransferase chain/domain